MDALTKMRAENITKAWLSHERSQLTHAKHTGLRVNRRAPWNCMTSPRSKYTFLCSHYRVALRFRESVWRFDKHQYESVTAYYWSRAYAAELGLLKLRVIKGTPVWPAGCMQQHMCRANIDESLEWSLFFVTAINTANFLSSLQVALSARLQTEYAVVGGNGGLVQCLALPVCQRRKSTEFYRWTL